MARIDYNGHVAAQYQSGRGAPAGGLDGWRDALTAHLPTPYPVLDVGAGIGLYSTLIREWFDQEVIAMEPAYAMIRQLPRDHAAGTHPVVGRAEQIPLRAGSCGAAWLSTMIHHIDHLPDAAVELRRVLRTGAPVLIRSVFPGQQAGIALYRYFPTAGGVVDTFPTVDDVSVAFGAAGFHIESRTTISQVNAVSLGDFYAKARHRANTTLLAMADDEFAADLERLRIAAEDAPEDEPVVSRLDLLVLRGR